MLMIVVLAVFGKTHCRESLLGERRLIASTQITIRTKNHERLKTTLCEIRGINKRDVAGEFARWAVILAPLTAELAHRRICCRGRGAGCTRARSRNGKRNSFGEHPNRMRV